jgi:hypothetical protein
MGNTALNVPNEFLVPNALFLINKLNLIQIEKMM